MHDSRIVNPVELKVKSTHGPLSEMTQPTKRVDRESIAEILKIYSAAVI
jgi:hypothetical protein